MLQSKKITVGEQMKHCVVQICFVNFYRNLIFAVLNCEKVLLCSENDVLKIHILVCALKLYDFISDDNFI